MKEMNRKKERKKKTSGSGWSQQCVLYVIDDSTLLINYFHQLFGIIHFLGIISLFLFQN